VNPATLALRGRTVVLVFALLLLVGGLWAFSRLGRLEDPEFTIKDAVVVTPYSGATADEVAREVSDEIERAVQAMAQVDHVRSRSEPGRSIVTVTIRDQYDRTTLPQVWDELRRRVGDAQGRLPPGAGPSLVRDDFGDVYGVFVAITGDEYSLSELRVYAERLQQELLVVEDVAKVELFAAREEAVEVAFESDRVAQLGGSPAAIAEVVRARNLVADAGRVAVGPSYVRFVPVQAGDAVADLADLQVAAPGGGLVRLGDVARVRRVFRDPPDVLLRVDGAPAVGLAISTAPGGNVVTMGQALERKMAEITYLQPLGVSFHVIALQSKAVTEAIGAFVVNLVEAVAIVVVVLLLFMGLRSGLLIGAVLLLTICGTFLLMYAQGILLERISLGALVIALGMLVDNAIVVVDGTLAGMARGQRVEAASEAVVRQTAVPLLMATAIAILSFAAIGTSNDGTGEYCRSLYYVIMYALGLSWVTAVTVTPVLCAMFLRPPKQAGEASDGGFMGRGVRRLLGVLLPRRGWAALGAVGLLAAAVVGFGGVEQSFFPASTRPQIMVDLWMRRATRGDGGADDDAGDAAAAVGRLLRVHGGDHRVRPGLRYGADPARRPGALRPGLPHPPRRVLTCGGRCPRPPPVRTPLVPREKRTLRPHRRMFGDGMPGCVTRLVIDRAAARGSRWIRRGSSRGEVSEVSVFVEPARRAGDADSPVIDDGLRRGSSAVLGKEGPAAAQILRAWRIAVGGGEIDLGPCTMGEEMLGFDTDGKTVLAASEAAAEVVTDGACGGCECLDEAPLAAHELQGRAVQRFAACAAIEPTPDRRRWGAGIRSRCGRFPAIRREFVEHPGGA